MVNSLEDDIATALAERASTLPGDSVDRVRAVDYHPRRHRFGKKVVITGAAGAATIACALTVALTVGAEPAFAGWSSAPHPSGAAAGSADCSQQLQTAVPPGGQSEQWSPVLSDVRGPYDLTVYDGDAGGVASCFAGPGFTTLSASSGTGSAHVTFGGSSAGTSDGPQHGSSLQTQQQASGPISEISTTHFTLDNDGPYTIVLGQVDSDVTAVTLDRSDGTDVTATVGSGQFVAWWPGDADATSAEVTTASGTTTEQLPTPPAPPNS